MPAKTLTLADFLLARIAEKEAMARDLRRDLSAQIEAEGFIGKSDERGPFTPSRMLSAQLWSHYDGQTQWRNFARGQQIAKLADPARVLAECEARRRVIEFWESAGRQDAQARDLHMGPDWMDEQPTLSAVLRALALPYADHPDYRAEWA